MEQAYLSISGPQSTALQSLLMADDMQPGADLSYQLAKTIYLYHPLGAKMAESPISMAQSQKRDITVPGSPEERVKEAFAAEWKALGADRHIFNVMRQSRVYGVASIALMVKGLAPGEPVDYPKLYDQDIAFNVLDPLNTAGSLVMNQDPNALDFQKHVGITISGIRYHRSREVTVLNEEPIYIAYTRSAFGYVGRSVYQRALFPLKSFVRTMITDDMVSRKAGLLVAKMKAPGSIINRIMKTAADLKRALLRQAATDNVLSIDVEESIETLNLQNLDGAANMARTNILKNIATAADMPAKLLENETMVAGFGEGVEDAKNIAKYIDRIRELMDPLYTWFDKIVMYRAWNPEFYKDIQREFPAEYGKMKYETAFYAWRNAFQAKWPSLLTEPDSEKSKTSKVKLDAVIELLGALGGDLDPENKARLYQWAEDNINADKFMFSTPLELDYEALREFDPAAGMGHNGEPALEEDGEEPAPKKPRLVAAE